MNARDIQRRLILDRQDRSILMPNFTPPKWWECDVFELTKAGFFVEYEIKLTTADFRVDAKKSQRRFEGVWPDQKITLFNKHQLLSAGAHEGPSKFYFVAPDGVIPPNELPEWAGLIIVRPRAQHRPPYSVSTEIIKPAPQLHRVKVDSKIKERIYLTAYYRFNRMFLHSEFSIDPQRTENENEMEKEKAPSEGHLV